METVGLYHSTKDYDLSLSLMDNSSYKLFGEMIASSGGKDESTAGAMANIELPDIEYWVFTITPARQVPLQ
jgi:predicted transcriptional regulator YdeE